jgi:hypothetical protein
MGKMENRKELPSSAGYESDKARSQRFAPKKRDLVTQWSHHSGPVTTLMICNIPCRITQQQLVDVINGMGFSELYDFLYLPTGGRSSTVGSSNLGYGFINFTDPSNADPFTQAFAGYQFEGTSSTKVCTVRPAHMQGLESNVLHFDRTAAKGRPRREGPFIRAPAKDSPSLSEHSEESTQAAESMQDFNTLQDFNELPWLEPSSQYFDFLDESPDLIVGFA